MYIRVIFLLICIPFFSFSVVEINKRPDPIEKFNLYATKVFNEWNLPGMAYAIVQNGKVIHIKCLGYGNLDKKTKINQDTVFRIASLSKTFTAVLAAKIKKKYDFNFEEKIIKSLPHIEFKEIEKANKITIADLLKHTTGFPVRGFTNLVENNKVEYHHIHKEIKTQAFTHMPGIKYNYQNYMYNLVADILESKTGRSFSDLIKEEITDKAEMTNTSVGFDSYLYSDNKAWPHTRMSKLKYKISYPDLNSNYYKLPAAGGINSTIKDMAKWLQIIMGEKPEIISQNDLSILQKPYIATNFAEETCWNKSSLIASHYGYGFRVHNYGGDVIIHHGGAIQGFRTSIAFVPGKKIGIVILSNANSAVPALLTGSFIDLILDFDFKDYSKKMISAAS